MNYKDMSPKQQASICWTSLAVQDINTHEFFVTSVSKMTGDFIECQSLEARICSQCGHRIPNDRWVIKPKHDLYILTHCISKQ